MYTFPFFSLFSNAQSDSFRGVGSHYPMHAPTQHCTFVFRGQSNKQKFFELRRQFWYQSLQMFEIQTEYKTWHQQPIKSSGHAHFQDNVSAICWITYIVYTLHMLGKSMSNAIGALGKLVLNFNIPLSVPVQLVVDDRCRALSSMWAIPVMAYFFMLTPH
jgi:hypothetical protein